MSQGSELTCHVITEADDDNKRSEEDGQNIIHPLAAHQVANLCSTPKLYFCFYTTLSLHSKSVEFEPNTQIFKVQTSY